MSRSGLGERDAEEHAGRKAELRRQMGGAAARRVELRASEVQQSSGPGGRGRAGSFFSRSEAVVVPGKPKSSAGGRRPSGKGCAK